MAKDIDTKDEAANDRTADTAEKVQPPDEQTAVKESAEETNQTEPSAKSPEPAREETKADVANLSNDSGKQESTGESKEVQPEAPVDESNEKLDPAPGQQNAEKVNSTTTENSEPEMLEEIEKPDTPDDAVRSSDAKGEQDAEPSLDVFEDVAAGDGDASDPSKTGDRAAAESNPTTVMNEIAQRSGDGDASDPSEDNPNDGAPAVRQHPDEIDLKNSGDGDVSDPSRTGDADGTDPSDALPDEVDLNASGDGDVSDPSDVIANDATGSVVTRPIADVSQLAGARDATEPTKTEDTDTGIASAQRHGSSDDLEVGDEKDSESVRKAPDATTLAGSGDGDVSDPSRSGNDDTTDPVEVAGSMQTNDLDARSGIGLGGASIDPGNLATIREQLSEVVQPSGEINQSALADLFSANQILPDQTSQVSTPVAQPVEINESGDGSFTVIEKGIDKTTARIYDSNGNLVTQQIDGVDGSVILDYSVPGSVTNTMIFDDGVIIVAVHHDDGSGTLEITDAEGNTSRTTITPPSSEPGDTGTDAQDQNSGDTDSGENSSSDSDSGNGDSDDDDSDDETESPDSESSATETSTEESSEGDGESEEGKGTPNPLDDSSDGPALSFVTGGRLGGQEQSDTERGIEVATGGGHTDPIDDDAEATVEFLTSDLGKGQAANDEKAIENAQGSGHTDPADDDVDVPDFITPDELEHLEFVLGGGGVVDPVDGESNGGGLPDGGGIPVGPAPENGPSDAQSEELDGESGSAFQANIAATHESLDAIAEAAGDLLDAFEIQVEVDLDDLDDDF